MLGRFHLYENTVFSRTLHSTCNTDSYNDHTSHPGGMRLKEGHSSRLRAVLGGKLVALLNCPV